MNLAKAVTVSIFSAALLTAVPTRALAPAALDPLSASAPVPEPRDFVLLVMSLAAIALVGRRSK